MGDLDWIQSLAFEPSLMINVALYIVCYSPIFKSLKNQPIVGKYTIHGWYYGVPILASPLVVMKYAFLDEIKTCGFTLEALGFAFEAASCSSKFP